MLAPDVVAVGPRVLELHGPACRSRPVPSPAPAIEGKSVLPSLLTRKRATAIPTPVRRGQKGESAHVDRCSGRAWRVRWSRNSAFFFFFGDRIHTPYDSPA